MHLCHPDKQLRSSSQLLAAATAASGGTASAGRQHMACQAGGGSAACKCFFESTVVVPVTQCDAHGHHWEPHTVHHGDDCSGLGTP